ncbi:hypothetical protein H6P81_010082 [Aristolochia fimbriata]|uniref:Uncharacterized protein n=1 Tax=Aristolochia fimbriata TaxID=158543 RepID=A0AAV7ER65_ARIFI|nr:hypothetical protein H6P81_010082 [Aristolochia fimbriata]
MARFLISIDGGGGCSWQTVPMGVGLFVAVVALVALCAKHARKASRKLIPRVSEPGCGSRIVPKSPKVLLTTLSNKAMPFLQRKKGGEELDDGFGDGGLWQRDILMGEKCQPLDFSGVIYYDSDGKQLPEIPPRSPRVTPLQSSFSFPVVVTTTEKAGSTRSRSGVATGEWFVPKYNSGRVWFSSDVTSLTTSCDTPRKRKWILEFGHLGFLTTCNART